MRSGDAYHVAFARKLPIFALNYIFMLFNFYTPAISPSDYRHATYFCLSIEMRAISRPTRGRDTGRFRLTRHARRLLNAEMNTGPQEESDTRPKHQSYWLSRCAIIVRVNYITQDGARDSRVGIIPTDERADERLRRYPYAAFSLPTSLAEMSRNVPLSLIKILGPKRHLFFPFNAMYASLHIHFSFE